MAAPQSDVLRIEEIAVDDSEDLGSIAFVTIDRPDKLNALNAKTISEIKPIYNENTEEVDGRILLRDNRLLKVSEQNQMPLLQVQILPNLSVSVAMISERCSQIMRLKPCGI